MQPVVQVAIDATSMDEGIRLADAAIRAGVDWLEAGTPFIHAEGMHGHSHPQSQSKGFIKEAN